MESSDQISEETRNSYRELQQLMDELDDPELRRAMEELRRAMESLSADQIEQALQNVSFNEQLYKERIERTERKSTRLNSSHVAISYAVFCSKKTRIIMS